MQFHMLFAVPPVSPGKLFSAEKICKELLSIRKENVGLNAVKNFPWSNYHLRVNP